MNKVILVGRLTRDPEMRALASGKTVTMFAMTTNEYVGNGHETAEHHAVVVWDRLAPICAMYLGKGHQVAVEGRLQTRQWDDDLGRRYSKTEVVASPPDWNRGVNSSGSVRGGMPTVSVLGMREDRSVPVCRSREVAGQATTSRDGLGGSRVKGTPRWISRCQWQARAEARMPRG